MKAKLLERTLPTNTLTITYTHDSLYRMTTAHNQSQFIFLNGIKTDQLSRKEKAPMFLRVYLHSLPSSSSHQSPFEMIFVRSPDDPQMRTANGHNITAERLLAIPTRSDRDKKITRISNRIM